MVETLTNVKNGKVKSSATSEAGNDAAQRMKKFLSGLGRKRRCGSVLHYLQFKSNAKLPTYSTCIRAAPGLTL